MPAHYANVIYIFFSSGNTSFWNNICTVGNTLKMQNILKILFLHISIICPSIHPTLSLLQTLWWISVGFKIESKFSMMDHKILYHLVITYISSILWYHSSYPLCHTYSGPYSVSWTCPAPVFVLADSLACNRLLPYHHLNFKKVLFVIYIWRFTCNLLKRASSGFIHPILIFCMALIAIWFSSLSFSFFPSFFPFFFSLLYWNISFMSSKYIQFYSVTVIFIDKNNAWAIVIV